MKKDAVTTLKKTVKNAIRSNFSKGQVLHNSGINVLENKELLFQIYKIH